MLGLMPSGIRIRKCHDCFELAFSCGALEGFDAPIMRTFHEACEQFVRRILIIRESDPEKQECLPSVIMPFPFEIS
jgi:hypothetical protein